MSSAFDGGVDLELSVNLMFTNAEKQRGKFGHPARLVDDEIRKSQANQNSVDSDYSKAGYEEEDTFEHFDRSEINSFY